MKYARHSETATFVLFGSLEDRSGGVQISHEYAEFPVDTRVTVSLCHGAHGFPPFHVYRAIKVEGPERVQRLVSVPCRYIHRPVCQAKSQPSTVITCRWLPGSAVDSRLVGSSASSPNRRRMIPIADVLSCSQVEMWPTPIMSSTNILTTP